MKNILKKAVKAVDPELDYHGQRLNMFLMYVIYLLGFTVAFLAGIFLNNLKYTLMVTVATIVLNGLVTLPGWKIYRRHPLRYKKEKDD